MESTDADAAEGAAPGTAVMIEEERFAALFGTAKECVTPEELRLLLRGNPHPVCYDGFEPSGRMLIAQSVRDHFENNKGN